jgi:hypothetical protein
MNKLLPYHLIGSAVLRRRRKKKEKKRFCQSQAEAEDSKEQQEGSRIAILKSTSISSIARAAA